MAKTKYQRWLEPDGLILLEGWARDGLTNDQIAHNMGCGLSTLKVWRDQHIAISTALKKGKEVADREVENALHKKALGYNAEVRKTFKLKRVWYEEGRRCEEETLEVGVDEVHVPADTAAQIFWLKNRKPEKWRDKPADVSDTESLDEAKKLLGGVPSAID